MGWMGYGKYDGDGTATVQMEIIELAGFKKNIPLKNGEVLDESSSWYVGREKLDAIVVQSVFDKWEKIEKKIIRPYLDNEDKSINYMMASDFFMNHDFKLPDTLKEKTIKSVNYLITEGHSDDFDKPASRKKVLKNFLTKLENYEETKDISLTTKKKVKP